MRGGSSSLSNGGNVTLTIPHGETVRRRRQRADAATENRRRRWSTEASGGLLQPELVRQDGTDRLSKQWSLLGRRERNVYGREPVLGAHAVCLPTSCNAAVSLIVWLLWGPHCQQALGRQARRAAADNVRIMQQQSRSGDGHATRK